MDAVLDFTALPGSEPGKCLSRLILHGVPIFGELESQPNTSPVVSDANASSVVGVVSIMAPVGSLTVTVPEETLEAPAPMLSSVRG